MRAAGGHRRGMFPLSPGRLIGIAVAAFALAAGGIAAVSLTGSGHGASGGPAASRPGSVSGGNDDAASAARQPALASSPHVAVMPAPAPHASGTPKPRPSGSHSAPASGATAPAASTAPSTSTPPAAAGSTSCANPQFVTSAPFGIWGNDGYFVYNNMWNASGYSVSQTLYACSFSNWYVVARMNNDSGNGAVKTYPNAQMDFNEPKISSLTTVTSTFAQSSPDIGIYEDAYDIWLNGVASSGSTEVMIWTQNHGQVPAGSPEATVTLDGRSYTVYRTSSGGYIAFVSSTNYSSGTVNLLDFFNWLTGKGWIPQDSTLGQVCYGAELVSTSNVPATFSFSNFSVSAS